MSRVEIREYREESRTRRTVSLRDGEVQEAELPRLVHYRPRELHSYITNDESNKSLPSTHTAHMIRVNEPAKRSPLLRTTRVKNDIANDSHVMMDVGCHTNYR